MAVGYTDQDTGQLVIFAKRGELAPIRKRRMSRTEYWALTTFGVLADEEIDQFPITRWKFDSAIQPAVLRILQARRVRLEMTPKEICHERVSAVLNMLADTLHNVDPLKQTG